MAEDRIAKVEEALRLIGPTAFSSGDAHARFVELTKEEDPATPAQQAEGIPAPASVTDYPPSRTDEVPAAPPAPQAP